MRSDSFKIQRDENKVSSNCTVAGHIVLYKRKKYCNENICKIGTKYPLAKNNTILKAKKSRCLKIYSILLYSLSPPINAHSKLQLALFRKKALIIAPVLHILEHCGPINCVPRGGLAIIANNCKKDDQKSWALVLDAMHKGQG